MHELILVVDSDTARLRKLREILGREGYNIMTATDRETAIQICRRIPVQLVLGETYQLGFGDEQCAGSEIEINPPNIK
jgi:PleD family two-component response regulator